MKVQRLSLLSLLLLCILFFFSLLPSSLAADSDFTIVEQRLLESLLPSSLSSLQNVYNEAKNYSITLQEGGYWKDINYSDQNRVLWPAAEHLTPRLLSMATAYVATGQELYHNATLFTKINEALNFWLAKNFQNPNWWWNEISVPTSIAQITFLLKSFLTSSQINSCVDIMNKANWDGWTGANLVWMANVHIYRGCVTNNQTDVSDALNHIYATISITDGIDDGIKSDASFYQHGQQLYSGGYGASFTDSILPYLNITVNTTFAISGEALDVFGLMVLDGQQWMTFYSIWDVMVIGRAITRPTSYANQFNRALLETVGGPRHDEFVEFALRLNKKVPNLVGNRHYWKSDYMVHHRPNYSASIRMYSERTYNSECVNSEGLKSLHLADGVFNIYQTGLEYNGIFAAWDWERIPGITCALGEVPISCETLKVLGKTSYVGGVSDGYHGIAAQNFAAALNGKLTARKAWFLFENEMVALGNSITCDGCTNPIVTTINQCLLNGDVYASNAATTPIASGNRTLADDVWWVFHDNVGYVFPHSFSLGLANGIQTGTWESINLAYSGTVHEEVFNFWVNQKGDLDTYEYIVLPNISLSTLQTSAANHSLDVIQILHNTNAQQVVYHTELQILSAVFWDSGNVSVTAPINYVSCSYSAIAMVSFTKSNVSVYVSDPNQKTSQAIQIRLGVKTSGGKGCTVEGSETVLDFVTSNDAEFAGQTMEMTCDL